MRAMLTFALIFLGNSSEAWAAETAETVGGTQVSASPLARAPGFEHGGDRGGWGGHHGGGDRGHGGGHGGGDHGGWGDGGRRPPPPPPSHQDLCSGGYWGGFNNGVQATLYLTHTGYNSINVSIVIKGGYTFTGQGTCDQWGSQAQLYFTAQGPGTGVSYLNANAQVYGNGATLSGYQQNGGPNFFFQR